jgi:hypothetical protein
MARGQVPVRLLRLVLPRLKPGPGTTLPLRAAPHRAPLQGELRALTVGQGYYFAVEAFNENGVSRLGDIVSVKGE